MRTIVGPEETRELDGDRDDETASLQTIAPRTGEANSNEQGLRSSSETFSALYRSHRSDIRRICGSILRDQGDADDATEEVFAKAWQAMLEGRTCAQRYPWLRVVARNHCIDQLRRRSRSFTADAPTIEAVSPTENGCDDEVLDSVVASLARDAVRRVSPGHRAILALREGLELSYQEIAKREAIPLSSVESRLYRARQALRREYLSLVGPDGLAAMMWWRLRWRGSSIHLWWTQNTVGLSGGSASISSASTTAIGGVVAVAAMAAAATFSPVSPLAHRAPASAPTHVSAASHLQAASTTTVAANTNVVAHVTSASTSLAGAKTHRASRRRARVPDGARGIADLALITGWGTSPTSSVAVAASDPTTGTATSPGSPTATATPAVSSPAPTTPTPAPSAVTTTSPSSPAGHGSTWAPAGSNSAAVGNTGTSNHTSVSAGIEQSVSQVAPQAAASAPVTRDDPRKRHDRDQPTPAAALPSSGSSAQAWQAPASGAQSVGQPTPTSPNGTAGSQAGWSASGTSSAPGTAAGGAPNSVQAPASPAAQQSPASQPVAATSNQQYSGYGEGSGYGEDSGRSGGDGPSNSFNNPPSPSPSSGGGWGSSWGGGGSGHGGW